MQATIFTEPQTQSESKTSKTSKEMEMELLQQTMNGQEAGVQVIKITEAQLTKATNHLKKQYVYMEDVADILYTGLKLNRNVLLFGRGGHNKSVAAEEYLTIATGKAPYVIACHANMTIDDLFGPVSAKEYRENDRFIRNTVGSFINNEFVILEEMADMPTYVMEALKDALSSKQLRNGDQVVPVQTKFIIACTNKDPKTLILDESIEAFLQRFPLKLKVEWNSYKQKNYSRLFKVVLNDDFSTLSSLIESVTVHGTFVSPRIALEMANVYKNMGVEYLRFFDGVNVTSMKEFKEMLKNEGALKEVSKADDELKSIEALLKNLDAQITKLGMDMSAINSGDTTIFIPTLETHRTELYSNIGKISTHNVKLTSLIVPESAYESVSTLKDRASSLTQTAAVIEGKLSNLIVAAAGNGSISTSDSNEMNSLLNMLDSADEETED